MLRLRPYKHCDAEKHQAHTGVSNAPILRNLQAAVKAGKHVIARIPVIPRFNSSISDAKAMAAKLQELGVREVHLLPFHQFGEKKYEQLGVAYEMTGVKQLHPEVLENYRKVYLDHGLDCNFK